MRGERRVVVRARRSQVNNKQQYDHYHKLIMKWSVKVASGLSLPPACDSALAQQQWPWYGGREGGIKGERVAEEGTRRSGRREQ